MWVRELRGRRRGLRRRGGGGKVSFWKIEGWTWFWFGGGFDGADLTLGDEWDSKGLGRRCVGVSLYLNSRAQEDI